MANPLKNNPGGQPALELNPRTREHGGQTEIEFALPDERGNLRFVGVNKWRDPHNCARPVTIAAEQILKSPPSAAAIALLDPAALRYNPLQRVPAYLRLKVDWGTGGSNLSATMDLVRGVSFQVVAHSVDLSVQYVGLGSIDPTLVPLPNVLVRSSVGEQPLGGLPPPRLTMQLGAVDPGAPGATTIVPAYAWRVRPSVPYPVGGHVTLAQRLITGEDLWDALFAKGEPEATMVLDGPCGLVNLQHQGLQALPRADLIFDLDL